MALFEFDMRSEADGLVLQGYRARLEAPRALLVLSHGAAEHARRYVRFAEALAQAEIELWAIDQRGHGRSLGPQGLGDLADAGWAGLIADLVQLLQRARAARPALPMALFGHSMGSFAAQQVCIDHSQEIDALVLSGSTALELRRPGERLPPFTPNAAFEPARTPYDWLSRDPEEVDKYIADPLCGLEHGPRRTFDAAAVRMLNDPNALAFVRVDLPVLLLAGDADPVNRGLSGLHELERRYRKAGVRQVDTLYYPGGRHEMLNEINRAEVIEDVIEWLRAQLAREPDERDASGSA